MPFMFFDCLLFCFAFEYPRLEKIKITIPTQNGIMYVKNFSKIITLILITNSYTRKLVILNEQIPQNIA